MSDELQAGRELDALIATQVMGWKDVEVFRDNDNAVRDVNGYEGDGLKLKGVPCYSTDIGAAWQAVEALRGLGFKFDLNDRNGQPGKGYWAEFATEDYDRGAQAWEATMPLAICCAALKVIKATP